jgi:hypothetical protein
MNVHETYALLEARRRDSATARHMLEYAHPDDVLVWRERLEQAEAAERDLLQQLAELEKPAKKEGRRAWSIQT